eukprot:198605_1
MSLCIKEQLYLIHGYIRHIDDILIGWITPDSVIKLCSQYYIASVNMDESFAFVDKNMTISKNNKVIANNSGNYFYANYKSAYCSSLISPNHNQTLIAKFKIIKCWFIDIGIEYGNYRSLKGNFADKTFNTASKFYAYQSKSGNKRSHFDKSTGKSYGETYSDDDIISMKLEFLPNAKFGNLYFSKNDAEYQNTQYKLPRNKQFRIAVCLCSSSTKSEVELICVETNDNHDGKKGNNNDQLHSESLGQVNEIDKLKNKINELKNVIETQQHRMNEIFETNEIQQHTIKSLQQEIQQYKQKEQKNELMEQNVKSDLLYLEQKLSEFTQNYEKDKILTIFKQSPETLFVQDEISALDLRLRSFGKHLTDLKSYIESLTIPNITQWKINDIIQWISMLENGRYRKYIHVFRTGFESDGIDSGDCLPDLTQSVLRDAPFNITNFRDRRDLVNHFQMLKSKQMLNNDDNINDAGTFNEYH